MKRLLSRGAVVAAAQLARRQCKILFSQEVGWFKSGHELELACRRNQLTLKQSLQLTHPSHESNDSSLVGGAWLACTLLS